MKLSLNEEAKEVRQVEQRWLTEQGLVAGLGKFFLLGARRSGAAWVRRIISGHPNLLCGAEGHLAASLLRPLERDFSGFNEGQKAEQRPDETRIESGDQVFLMRSVAHVQLAGFVGAQEDPKQDLLGIGDCTPENYRHLALLGRVFPEARFVHVIRDPRDAAVSYWFRVASRRESNMARSVEDYIFRRWLDAIEQARAWGEENVERYQELRYEDLVNPETAPAMTRRLFDFLGADSSPAVVSGSLRSAAFDKLSGGRLPGVEERDADLRKGVVGDHVEHLDDKTLTRVCGGPVAKMMREFGYLPPEVATAAPDATVQG